MRGQAFVDALQARTPDQRIDVYAVNYPASLDFPRAAEGVADATNRVRDVAARCPTTKIVLGGYSQGAAVVAYLTADALPEGYVLPDTLPPEVARHVDAVALFGKPSSRFLNLVYRDAPPIVIGAGFSEKTVDLLRTVGPRV